MRFLLDNSVSWRIARSLREAGHDAIHVADLGLADEDDAVIYQRAMSDRRFLITQDADFSAHHSSANEPVAVVLFRLSTGRPSVLASTLLASLPTLAGQLEGAPYVTLTDDGIWVRPAGPR